MHDSTWIISYFFLPPFLTLFHIKFEWFKINFVISFSSRLLFRAQLLRLSNPSRSLRPLVHQVRLNYFNILKSSSPFIY
jgi:hypothetical protein